jgi:hypothetical protein
MNNFPDINFSNKSMVDDFGRVFFYKNRVFRKVNLDKKEYCIELLNSDLFSELTQKNLIPPTKISNEFGSSDELILEHKKILETLQHEWSFQMYKDAALMVLEVNKICNYHGYELKDAHTLNVLFDNFSPVFIDFGSISKLNQKSKKGFWIAYDEFLNSFFVPLLFWSNNRHYIVRKLLESNFHRMVTIPHQSLRKSGLLDIVGIPDFEFSFSLKNRIIFTSKRRYSLIAFITKLGNFLSKKILKKRNKIFKYEQISFELDSLFLKESIQQKILNLKFPSASSQWNGYHKKFYDEINHIKYPKRFKKLLEIIKNHQDIKNVIDLAGNEGYFSILLSQEANLDRIVLADYDENVIDNAYENFKKLNISNITPILLNFMFTIDLPGTAKRYQSDLVIALAITHHLILSHDYSLSTILERLVLFSNKYVMVEFMPLGLWSIENKIAANLPKWYSIDWFRGEFVKHFDILLEEQLEENRIVFFGKIL